LPEDLDVCVYCNADLRDSISYDDKIILSLDHPILDVRMVSINLVGDKGIKEAVPKLSELANKSSDPLELIAICKALKRIDSGESIKLIEIIKQKNNKIVNHYIDEIMS
jgi:HEAT repeat protein